MRRIEHAWLAVGGHIVRPLLACLAFLFLLLCAPSAAAPAGSGDDTPPAASPDRRRGASNKDPPTAGAGGLQTLGTLASDKSTTIVFPLPLDILGGLLDRARDSPA